MSINPDVHRKRPGIIGQVAVRMSIEMPAALRVAWPDSHRIVAKYNLLLRHVNLRQCAPAGEEMLLRSGWMRSSSGCARSQRTILTKTFSPGRLWSGYSESEGV